MAANESTASNAPGKPGIIDVEPVGVDVQPEYDANGVRLEVVDRDGAGFRTIFDLDAALSAATRRCGS